MVCALCISTVLTDRTNHLPFTVWIQILLNFHLLNLTILYLYLRSYSLASLLIILSRVDCTFFKSLTVAYITQIQLIVHQPIKCAAPSFLQSRLNFRIKRIVKRLNSKIILENRMRPKWLKGTQKQSLVNIFYFLVRKNLVRLADLQKFINSLLAADVIFWMVFKSKSSISSFYIFQSCSIRQLQNLIIIFNLFTFIFILSLKKLFLVFINEIVALQKMTEGRLSVLKRVSFFEDLIIVRSTVSIGQHLKSFINLVKFYLCLFFVLFVPFWMPFCYKFLIGSLNLIC